MGNYRIQLCDVIGFIGVVIIAESVSGGTLIKEKQSKRYLLGANQVLVWTTLEQYASCSLTCVPGYEKLTEACCNTGLDVLCSNLPWDTLKSSLGHCASNYTATSQLSASGTVWVSLEQFASCSLTCVPGYEKLADACCQTGNSYVCSNLPWDLLKTKLGSCQALPAKTTLSAKTTTAAPGPYWLPWGSWQCTFNNGVCFSARFRNCSTGSDDDCVNTVGGNEFSIEACTSKTCPDSLTSSPVTTTARATTNAIPDSCQDDPTSNVCNDKSILQAVCADNKYAWRFCPRSCNMCGTCWDYLNCSSDGAKKLFCSQDVYSTQYCRKTCGKCAYQQTPITLNACGDPVASERICDVLQSEICVCNDPDVRDLCQNYCNDKCTTKVSNPNCHPVSVSTETEILTRGILEYKTSNAWKLCQIFAWLAYTS